MKFNNHFHLEEKFNYKGINCYYGLNEMGFRNSYIEFNQNEMRERYCKNANLISNKNIEFFYDDIENICHEEISFVNFSSEVNDYSIIIIGNDYGHIHNLYDIEAMKEYFPEIYKEEKDHLERLNINRNNILKCTLGTKEICKEACINMCNTIIKYYNRTK